MIELHPLRHGDPSFLLNPALIHVIESKPDTVVTLTTGVKHVVRESPAEIADLVRAWHASILATSYGPPPELRVIHGSGE